MQSTRLFFMAKKHLNAVILKCKFKQTSVFLDFSKLLLDGNCYTKVDKTSCSTQ